MFRVLMLMLLAIQTATAAPEGEIYRCLIDGHTTIRNKPCNEAYTLEPPAKKAHDYRPDVENGMKKSLKALTDQKDTTRATTETRTRTP